MISRKNKHGRLGSIAAACMLPGVIAAQGVAERELTWSLEGGAEHTDNVGRRAADEESETVGIAALSFQLNTDRPRLDADVGAHLEYREYLDNAFESEVAGGLDGLVSYSFIPERFVWVVIDNFGQIARDRALVDTPDNRQNVNYFSTGPDITIGLGSRTALQLGGRISDAYYESTPEDHQSLTGSLALIRQLSDLTSVSLNGSSTEIEYEEEALFADYRLDQAFIRLAATGVRTTLSIDAGYTVVDREGESSDGLLARLEASRLIGARSRIGLSAGTEFATPGGAFRRDQTITGIETGADDAVVASDPYQLDYAYLTWNTDWERSAFTAVLSARAESHEIRTETDRETYGATVGISRQISRRLDAQLTAGYSEEEVVNAGFAFDEWLAGVALSWLLGDRLSLNLRLDHIEGSSDDGSRDFQENRAYIGIAYSQRGP